MQSLHWWARIRGRKTSSRVMFIYAYIDGLTREFYFEGQEVELRGDVLICPVSELVQSLNFIHVKFKDIFNDMVIQ